MRRAFVSILSLVVGMSSAFAESFLTAQSFPKDFNDLSFKSRMEFMEDDYEIYNPEYDENGFCIKNCAYPGLNIKQEQAISERDTQNAYNNSVEYQQKQTTQPVKLSVDTQNILNAVGASTQSSISTCANRSAHIQTGQKIPLSEPLAGTPRISSPYGPRKLEGKQSYHDGIDYAVPIGTPVYATADGVVERVVNDNRCGKGLRVKHGDGVTTIYCHLNKQYVGIGDFVGAGCQIAESGNTGHSTGPHLHYGMRDSKNNKIDPSQYTKRAN